jgi:putative cell wall-binding protein
MKNILVLNLLIFLAAFTITAQNAYNLNIVDDVITKSKIIIDDASLVSDEVIRVVNYD